MQNAMQNAPTSTPPHTRPARRPLGRLLATPARRITAGTVAAVILALVAGSIYAFGLGNPGGLLPLTVATVGATSGTVFTIEPSGSQANFTIPEVLMGQPNTVVGTTNQVAGQIAVNFQDPSKTQVGEIKVDLSTLATDNEFRTSALRHLILESDQPANQYAIFETTTLDGLPASITMGQPVSFQITGNLTIHQVTRLVTFDAQVTLLSKAQLTGTVQTTMKYADFNVSIPNVPNVAGVPDTVKLALRFTANAK